VNARGRTSPHDVLAVFALLTSNALASEASESGRQAYFIFVMLAGLLLASEAVDCGRRVRLLGLDCRRRSQGGCLSRNCLQPKPPDGVDVCLYPALPCHDAAGTRAVGGRLIAPTELGSTGRPHSGSTGA